MAATSAKAIAVPDVRKEPAYVVFNDRVVFLAARYHYGD